MNLFWSGGGYYLIWLKPKRSSQSGCCSRAPRSKFPGQKCPTGCFYWSLHVALQELHSEGIINKQLENSHNFAWKQLLWLRHSRLFLGKSGDRDGKYLDIQWTRFALSDSRNNGHGLFNTFWRYQIPKYVETLEKKKKPHFTYLSNARLLQLAGPKSLGHP